MKNFLRLLIALHLLLCPAAFAANETLSAREILDRVDDLFRGTSSRGQMSMTIKNPNWTRTLTLQFWNQGKNKALLRILAPQKEKGTATLRVDKDLWNYLPKVKRVIKLPSSMMSAAWMGSHFSNDDLVKESRFAEDYTFTVTFDGEKEGVKVWEITCIPMPDAALVWGKVLVRVEKETLMPQFSLYYDEDMKLARTMTFSDYKMLGGRRLPAKVTLVPANNPDESTVVVYNEINFNEKIADSIFSLRTLQE